MLVFCHSNNQRQLCCSQNMCMSMSFSRFSASRPENMLTENINYIKAPWHLLNLPFFNHKLVSLCLEHFCLVLFISVYLSVFIKRSASFPNKCDGILFLVGGGQTFLMLLVNTSLGLLSRCPGSNKGVGKRCNMMKMDSMYPLLHSVCNVAPHILCCSNTKTFFCETVDHISTWLKDIFLPLPLIR